MADPVKSAARWKTKYKVERVKDTLNSLREDMAIRYEAAMAELCATEGKVKEVINAYGVSTSQYVPCLNSSRQLYKLSHQQGISGESFALGAQVLLDKWAARGLEASGLDRICSTPRHQLPEHLLPTPLSLQRESRGSGTLDRLCVESGLVLVGGYPKGLFGRGQAGECFGHGIIAESLHALR